MIPITSKECHFILLTIRAIFNKNFRKNSMFLEVIMAFLWTLYRHLKAKIYIVYYKSCVFSGLRKY